MNLLDGKLVKEEYLTTLKTKLNNINKKLGLAVIQIGDNPASNLYISQKEKISKELGYNFIVKKFNEDSSEEQILKEITKLNEDNNIDGIILHLPIPDKYNKDLILNQISYQKDVDGLTKINMEKLLSNNPYLIPCTPQGIIDILNYYKIDYKHKNIVILGRSNLVGTPLYNLLIKDNPNITLCHSKTENLSNITRNADILITAIGRPNYITKDMIKDNVIIIDAGINYYNNKIYGDVDFNSVLDKASYITPVPGGVGQMTTYELAYNVYKAYCLKNNIKY